MKSAYTNDYMVRIHKSNGKSCVIHKSTIIIMQRIVAVLMMIGSLLVPMLLGEGFELTIFMWMIGIPMFLSDKPNWFYHEIKRVKPSRKAYDYERDQF